jgi:hypothetical protein
MEIGMTPEQAADRLAMMTAANTAPELDADLVRSLVAEAARVDTDGIGPRDPAWTPTYDLNRAAAEGWRLKAAMAAGQYSVTADGATFQRNQVFEHCERMAGHYAARVTSDAIVDLDREAYDYDAQGLLP